MGHSLTFVINVSYLIPYFDISVPYFVANIALNLTFVCSEQVIEGVFIKPERSEGVV